MRCPNCDAQNLDGADRCNSCGTALAESTDSPTRSAGSWWMLVAALLAVVLVGLMLSTMRPPGGGGGSGLATAASTPTGTPPATTATGAGASNVVTTVPTAEQAKRVTAAADAVIKKEFPALSAVKPWISAYTNNGFAYVSALYSVPDSATALGVGEVVVRINEKTGETNVVVSF